MKKRLGLAVTCVVVAGSLIGASSAAAAAEFGDACVANEACGVRKSERAEKDALTSDWWSSRTLVRKPQRPCLPPSLAIRSGGLRSAQTHAWR